MYQIPQLTFSNNTESLLHLDPWEQEHTYQLGGLNYMRGLTHLSKLTLDTGMCGLLGALAPISICSTLLWATPTFTFTHVLHHITWPVFTCKCFRLLCFAFSHILNRHIKNLISQLIITCPFVLLCLLGFKYAPIDVIYGLLFSAYCCTHSTMLRYTYLPIQWLRKHWILFFCRKLLKRPWPKQMGQSEPNWKVS